MTEAAHIGVNSYDPTAEVPEVGSVWVWELGKPHACCLIRVTQVRWNSEEWWVKTDVLLPAPAQPVGEFYNELGRFREAVTPVGDAGWTRHQVTDGVESSVADDRP